MKKVAFHTLGCKLNFAETSTIGRQFIERGFQVVDAGQPADVFVLNTCSVTERADRECRQVIRRALRHSPDVYVIVVGCYAQLRPDEIAGIDGVDLVIGSQEKFDIFRYADRFQKKPVADVFVSCIDEASDFYPAFSAEGDGRTRAFLKIQDGCDYVCAFCTIPHARGKSRSIPVDNIVDQAESIVRQGFKEIVLTGVNVGDYGRIIGTSLIKLMRALDGVEGVERYRISSIEPNLLTPEIIDFITGAKKFCNHFHLPLQSGSDTVLKRMRRRYLTGEYRNTVEYIKANDPNAGIGADVIVGFPGETDELFRETYRFLVDLPVSYLHVFTYSERPDTDAEDLDGAVEPRVRQERSEMLRILGRKKRFAFHQSYSGKTVPVLFEGNIDAGSISGLTPNYIRVETSGDKSIVNTIEQVTIIEAHDDICIGERSTALSQHVPVNRLEEISQYR